MPNWFVVCDLIDAVTVHLLCYTELPQHFQLAELLLSPHRTHTSRSFHESCHRFWATRTSSNSQKSVCVRLRCAPIMLTIRNAGVCRLFIAHAGCINSASDALQSLGARSADAKRQPNSRRVFARSKHAQVLLRHDDKHRRTHRVISHGTTLTANGHEECACAQGTHVMRNCLHLRHILLRQIRAHVCAHVTTQNTFAHEQIYILSAGPSGQVTLERTVIPPRATSACDVYRTEHILARQSIRVVRLNTRKRSRPRPLSWCGRWSVLQRRGCHRHRGKRRARAAYVSIMLKITTV